MRRVFGVVLAGVIGCTSACATAVAGTPLADPKATVRPSEPSGPVKLTVMVPGEQGYQELVADYQREHPNVTVQLQQLNYDVYLQKLQTMMAAGTPPDVAVIGDESRAEFFDHQADRFADLSDVGPADVDKKRWLDWKYKGGLTKDGTWVGYPTDIGPTGIAYRTDLFAAAGLPTDPAQVGQLLQSWDKYFAVGDQYVRATGKPWFDASSTVFTAMQNQLPTGYFDKDDQLAIESNTDIKANWDAVTGAVGRGQSAKLAPFSSQWNAGFRTGAFATVAAPFWMLSLIKLNGGPENAGKWAIADTFPGGGTNWGGDYLAVPKESKFPEQAAELAAWLSAPEQQLKAFKSANTFPSQVAALKSADVTGLRDTYFATADIGTRYATLAQNVTVAPYPSPRDSQVQNEAMNPALQAVEQGTPPDAGWQQVVAKAKEVAGG